METLIALLAFCSENPSVTGGFPPQRPVTRSSDVFFMICARTNGWAKNRDAGDLRRNRAHYDVTARSIVSVSVIIFRLLQCVTKCYSMKLFILDYSCYRSLVGWNRVLVYYILFSIVLRTSTLWNYLPLKFPSIIIFIFFCRHFCWTSIFWLLSQTKDILPCKTGYGSKAVKSNGALRWNYIRRDIKEYAKSIEGMFNWYLPLCTID